MLPPLVFPALAYYDLLKLQKEKMFIVQASDAKLAFLLLAKNTVPKSTAKGWYSQDLLRSS